MSNAKVILWGFGQAILVMFVCGITLMTTTRLQRWEAYADGFLDDLVLLLLFGIAALVSGTVVLTRPVYLILQQRTKDGFLLLLSTIVWLVIILVGLLIGIIFFDVHTIF